MAASPAASLAAPAAPADTVVAVERGTRLDVDVHRGSVAVTTWTRNAVQATANGRAGLAIQREGAVLKVSARSRRGPRATLDLRLTVPSWMAVNVDGNRTDVQLDGVGGDVEVTTVSGDIDVRGGSGTVALSSVDGLIRLQGARGEIRAEGVNDEIRIQDCSGTIAARTVNGDVILERVDAGEVAAVTVNGDITYDGAIRDEGRYRFSTHNGDVTMRIPRGTNATVVVAIYQGEVDTDFPVTISSTEEKGRRFQFTIGRGGAGVEIESFQGTILIRRRD